MTLRPEALPRALVVPSLPLRVARDVGGPGRVPAAPDRAVVLRIEPPGGAVCPGVSTLTGFHP